MVNSVFGDVFNIDEDTDVFGISDNISVFATGIFSEGEFVLEISTESYLISASGLIPIPILNQEGTSRNGEFILKGNISRHYGGGAGTLDNIEELNNRILYRFGRHRRQG